ncbi:nuclear GTPase SLIP-GC-like isoform X1 [Pimephales promelas]|uniref:nuclear GTPase SLIP-GC-like isoform X1 n=1 Tax=Pimephales promelas TaxID=90988 RepID=UPI0019558F46|nr:nuclear GTPase SLIP-GC-like isoform X1 [Pimephales promelas]
MALKTINFITWNVNGLKRQRDQKFQELQNVDVILFQETHIGEGDENIVEDFKDEWHIFYTKYTSSSKGSAILVRKTLDFKYISDEKDNSGAYVVLKCKLEGQPYTLVSVYNHQTDTKTLDKLSRYLQSMTTGLLVIGGDFNTVLNRFVDKKINNLTNNSSHSKQLLFVEKFMKSLQLVDVWRRKNPIKQDYTFYIKDSPVSRLDYFFVPEECMWRVGICEIRDSGKSENKDHRPVSLEINIPAMPIQKDPQIQTIFQWLNLKKDLLTDETGSSLGKESSHAVSVVDIVSAVQSLQVSDTPRPDGTPASSYKDKIQDLIPYIKMLYDRIHSGAFNCSETRFNETVKSPHDDSQHFFNVDYLIIATILARRLDDVIESLPKGRIQRESAAVMITPKTHHALISLSHIKDELEQQKRSKPTLSQDLLLIENLLSDANVLNVEKYKRLHQGCPLTPGLLMLALKSYASQLFGHLEKSGVFIFKQSVIVYFQPEDLDMVKATVESNTTEVYEIEILSKGNDELLKCLEIYAKDEDWDKESEENSSKADEMDDGSKVYQKSEYESKISEEDESMEVDVSRSAISGPLKEEMETFQGMKKNTPPLLPVPPQSSSSSDGTKRNRDHKSSVLSIQSPLTTDEIMEKARQIMKKFPKNSDQIDKGNVKKATIGIFGKSGEGKSSLLSAILGIEYLLPSGCFGACTAVVTQVEANLTDSNYTAEFELFSKEEWNKELEDLFRVLSGENEDRTDDLFEIAKEKITALYGDDADKKTLEELKNDDKLAEIERFINKERCFSTSSVSEFKNDVASYIQHSESSFGNWYWPLVKSVTIKIPDCRELLEHIVLVDIPGSGDCNRIRDDLWKSKLTECSSVWIVSDINRATTDSGPWGMVKHCTEELGPGGECKSINFICTKTDVIDPVAYMRVTRLPRDQDKDEKKLCILHRNGRAKMKVKEKLKKSKLQKIFSTDNQFKVLTVSSNAFFEPNLNLESSETEIPKLQDELRSLNKSIHKELVKDYVSEAKGTLLLIQRDQLETNKKMMEMKVMEFENNLKTSLKELRSYFDGIISDLDQCLTRGVGESVISCVASTRQLIEPNRDGSGFHRILGSFCKNYGCYRSKNWEKVFDLNKTLAGHLHECIEKDFNKIFPVTGKTGISAQEQIEKFSVIQNESANPTPLINNIQNFIQIEETQLKKLLIGEIVTKKKLIYSSIQTTIQREMASCYEEAAAMTGAGSMKKRQQLLINRVVEIKQDMFNKSKIEVLNNCNKLKLYVVDVLEKKMNQAIERSQSQTGKMPREDVSGDIEQLDRLLDQLSDSWESSNKKPRV